MKIIKTKNLPRPFRDTVLNKNNVKQYHINRKQSVYIYHLVYILSRFPNLKKMELYPAEYIALAYSPTSL